VDAADESQPSDAACALIDAPAPPVHGGGACSLDASSCSPGNESAFSAGAPPPPVSATPYPGLCTSQQIGSLYQSCIGSSATTSACNSFVASNGACSNCVLTAATASKWGPLVLVNDSFLINIGECIALVEPCNAACAAAYVDLNECQIAACTTGPGCDDAGAPAILACTNEAVTCTSCSGFAGAAAACESAMKADPADHPAATACGITATTSSATIQAIATAMCGSPP
jgi:hypothetical protein